MAKRNSKAEMKIFFDIAEELYQSKRTFNEIYNLPLRYWKNKELFIYEENGKGKVVKYSDLDKFVRGYASFFKMRINSQRGDYIALKLGNSPKWVYTFYGLLMAGFNVLLINPILRKEDAERLLFEANAKGIVTDDKETYSVQTISLDDLKIESTTFEPTWANEVAFSTSGTTGDSRVYVYTANNLVEQIYSAYCMPDTTVDIMYTEKFGKLRLLAIVPFAHIFGFVAVFLWYSFFGACIVFPNSISSNDIQYFSKTYKISHLYGVPLLFDSLAKSFKQTVSKESPKKQTLIEMMMKYNNGKISDTEAGIVTTKFFQNIVKNKILGKEIRYCIAGGSALSKETLETINGIGYPLYNGYGMTEIGVTSVELSPKVSQRNRGSIGKPLTNIEYKIENKELLVKTKQMHSYRFVNQEKIPAQVDSNGYFHTGDIAEIDGNGYAFIHGKVKEVIITANGENIYPEELENNFKNLPYVSNLAIIEHLNKVTLVLELSRKLEQEEIASLEKEIIRANDSLPTSMRIEATLLSLENIPLNASLKIKRFELKDRLNKNPEQFIALSRNENISYEGIDEKELSPLIDQVIEIFSNNSGIEKEKITRSSHFIIDLGGDSFTYMSMLSEVESTFNTPIPTETIGKINTPLEVAIYIYKNKN